MAPEKGGPRGLAAVRLPTEVTVDVAGHVKAYPALADQLAAHLADGGEIGSLCMTTNDFAGLIKASEGGLTAVEGWVWLDDSNVAYLIEVRGSGTYTIKGAAVYGTA